MGGACAGEERFLFSCPNDESYLEAALEASSALLFETEPDGIMLDKIRFPSPSNGFESLLGCFCDSCRSLFESQTGQSFEQQRERAPRARTRAKGWSERFLSAWKETGSFWKATGLERWQPSARDPSCRRRAVQSRSRAPVASKWGLTSSPLPSRLSFPRTTELSAASAIG